MKRIILLTIALFTFSIAFGQTTYDWLDTAPDANWKQGAANARWNPGGLYDIPPHTNILRFNNNHELTMTNNVNSGYSIHQVIFGAINTNNRTISGNDVNFNDFSGSQPKIENNSTGEHSFNLNITVGSTDLQINPVDGNLNLGGTINNNGQFLKIWGNNVNKATFNGVISGSGGFSIEQNSIVLFSAENTYTGLTNLNAGTLEFGIDYAINANSHINLNGGIVSTKGFNAHMGTLALVDDATIQLGTGNHDVLFANSQATSWTATKILTIDGWGTGAEGNIYIGNDATGLTATQLAQIHFTGYPVGAFILADGEIVPVNHDSDIDGPAIASQPNDIISSLVDTEPEALQVFDFDVWDYGTSDGLDTKITQITIKAGANNDQDWSNVLAGAKLSIDAGTTFVTTGTPIINSNNIVIPITSGDLIITDDNAKTVSLFVWLKTTGITDYGILEFEVTTISHGFTADLTGSVFADTFPGAISDQIYIDVTATKLQFKQQPTTVATNTVMSPVVTVAYTDANGNVDVDATYDITVSATGSTMSGTLTQTPTNGISTFNDLEFSVASPLVTLTAVDAASIYSVTSLPFVVYTACVSTPTILAQQDFDSNTTWTYAPENTVPFFDNGSDGFYGIHNGDGVANDDTGVSPNATNIDFINITNDFLFINDLDDEGNNGTTGITEIIFDTINITGQTNVILSFDYDLEIFAGTDLFRYTPIIDGTSGTTVLLNNNSEGTVSISIPDGATSLGLQLEIRQNSVSEYAAFDNFKITADTNATTWNGTVWSNATPTLLNKAIIAGNYNTLTDGGSINACACQVMSGANLSVTDGMYLLASNEIDNNGTIVVEHQGSLVQYVDAATNTGSGFYEIHKITRAYHEYDYNYWSSPVVGETVEDAFVTNSLLVAGTGDAGSNMDHTYYLNPANFNDDDDDGWDDNLDDWVNYSSGEMYAGKGYIAMGAGSDFPFDSADFETGFQQAISFNGADVNNGVIEVTLVNDNDTSTTVSSNLVGNPYPSAIDAIALYTAPENNPSGNPVITQTAYLWSHDTQIAAGNGPWAYNFTDADYATLNLATGVGVQAHSGGANAPSQYIASGQGFMVEYNPAVNGVLTFKNSMRLLLENSHFMRTNETSTDMLWLNMTDETGLFRQIAVGFYDDAADTYDKFDSKRKEFTGEPNFYSIPQESNDELAIQGLTTFNEDKTVALGIEIIVAGTYEINIDHFEGVFTEEQAIYLEDTYEAIIHDFANGAYSFTSEIGDAIEDRFELRFTNDTLGFEDTILNSLAVYPNPSSSIFSISLRSNEELSIEVYDLTGKIVLSQFTGNQIDLSGYAKGIYFAKLSIDGVQTVKKLVLK